MNTMRHELVILDCSIGHSNIVTCSTKFKTASDVEKILVWECHGTHDTSEFQYTEQSTDLSSEELVRIESARESIVEWHK